jgi:O-antigen ligase
MAFLQFIISHITYKRFLLFWALVGMLITHSWITEPTSSDLAHYISIYGNLCFGCIGLCGFLLSIFLNKFDFQFKISGYAIGILLYFAAAIASVIINHSSISFYDICQLAIPLGFGLSFVYAFSTKELNGILVAVTLFGLLNVIMAFAIFFLGLNDIVTPFASSGLITDRNGFVRYLSLVNVFILVELFLQKQMVKKVVLAGLVFLIFISVLIQYSRSGYIVYLVSTGIVLFATGSKSIRRIALIFLPIVLILFALFTLHRVHTQKMQVANYSDLARVYVAVAGMNMIKAHPIKGIGFRMSDRNIRQYADKKLPSLPNLVAIHNWFIAIWAETGIVGLIVFIGLNFSLMYSCLKRFRKLGFADGRYALFSFVSLVVLMIDAQVLPNYDYESIYWIIIAISIISLSTIKAPNNI